MIPYNIHRRQQSEKPVVLRETEFDRCENVIIFLSYLIFFLTFPIAILFCLKTATVFERIIVFRLGKLRPDGVLGPGLVFILPCVDDYIVVDLRTRSFNVNPQEIITKDSVSIRADAVVYYSINNPLDCITQIANARIATKLLAQSTLRSVVGANDLMELLTAKEALSMSIKMHLEHVTQNWGVKVERVEIKQIQLPESLQRAMAAEQEASREAQGKIAAAYGELAASTNLKAASDVIKNNPIAVQLRYLQTLTAMSSENSRSIIFPLPTEMLRRLRTFFQGSQPTAHNAVSAISSLEIQSTASSDTFADMPFP